MSSARDAWFSMVSVIILTWLTGLGALRGSLLALAGGARFTSVTVCLSDISTSICGAIAAGSFGAVSVIVGTAVGAISGTDFSSSFAIATSI